MRTPWLLAAAYPAAVVLELGLEQLHLADQLGWGYTLYAAAAWTAAVLLGQLIVRFYAGERPRVSRWWQVRVSFLTGYAFGLVALWSGLLYAFFLSTPAMVGVFGPEQMLAKGLEWTGLLAIAGATLIVWVSADRAPAMWFLERSRPA